MTTNTYQQFTQVNQHQVRITRDVSSHDILDIEIKVNRTEQQEFFKHFEHQGFSYENSCYTFILQNHLAQFQEKRWSTLDIHNVDKKEEDTNNVMIFLRALSEKFSKLEVCINNASYADAFGNLQRLKDCLQATKKEMLAQLDECPPCLQDNVQSLKDDISRRFDEFEKGVRALEESIPTQHQVRELFGLQAQHWGQLALGDFICENLYAITDFGMEQVYRIQNSTLGQLFHMHPALKSLSDAKAMIGKKGFSLYARRYNNTRTPIPATMLASLKSETFENEEQRWMSFKPFLSRIDNLEKIEDMVCFIADTKSVRTQSGINPGFKIFAFIAAVCELPVVILHVALSLVSAVLPFKHWRVTFSRWLSDMHAMLSPLRHAKALAHSYYRTRSSYTEELKTTIQGDATSKFNQLINQYASADVLFSYVKDSVSKVIFSLTHIGLDGVYTLFTFDRRKQAIAVKQQITQELQQSDQALLEKLSKKLESVEVGEAKVNRDQKWLGISPWDANEFSSFLDFMDEILVGLSDVVVDPMFRKSPGLATFFFFLSVGSMTVTLLPTALFAKFGPVGKALETVLTFFSKQFTGRGLEGGVLEHIFAAFLFWKAGFFLSEALIEGLHGDFEFLESIFGETEKVTLGLMFLMSLGAGMQYVPHLPATVVIAGQSVVNPITSMINLFTLESKHCSHGQFPLNGIEYAFLGLKSLLLLYSLVSGNHTTAISPLEIEPLVKTLVEDFRNAKLFEAKAVDDREAIFTQVCAKHNLPAKVTTPLWQHVETLIQAKPISVEPQPELAPSIPDEWEVYFDARKELSEAVSIISRLEFYGKKFPSKFKAKLFYDDLDRVFENYNASLRGIGYHCKQVEKSRFLDVFFDKYCYSGSSNGIKLITMVLYPLTCFWRLIKYIAATKISMLKSPAITHQIYKSFSKELAILIQPLAILGRFFQALGRSLRNVFQLKFHKICLLSPLGALYSRATRRAGTVNDVKSELEQISQYLRDTDLKYDPSKESAKDANELVILDRALRKRSKSFSLWSSEADESLVRLSQVVCSDADDMKKTSQVKQLRAELGADKLRCSWFSFMKHEAAETYSPPSSAVI